MYVAIIMTTTLFKWPQWFYGCDDGTLTTAWLGDLTTTSLSTASNVILNLPVIPLRTLSGNTWMVTFAITLPTENCAGLIISVKKSSPTQIQE